MKLCANNKGKLRIVIIVLFVLYFGIKLFLNKKLPPHELHLVFGVLNLTSAAFFMLFKPINRYSGQLNMQKYDMYTGIGCIAWAIISFIGL